MRQKAKWLMLILAGSIAGLVLYFGIPIIQFGMGIHDSNGDSRFDSVRDRNPDTQQNTFTPPAWEGKERVNILLLGGDSRGLGPTEVPRADAIMIVSIDPVAKKASLLSVLRDTYVHIPGHGMNRINAALSLGGPELAMKTVSELTGLDMQFYVYADFEGFIRLVDAMGGVDFYVEKNMYYPDEIPEYSINLKQGYQHLDGRKALQYVRFRHDALSDYTRTERQRNFLKALAEKAQSPATLIRLPKLLNEVEPYIETNLTLFRMMQLGTLGLSLDLGSTASLQVPPRELLREEETAWGASVITVNETLLQEWIREQLEAQSEPEPGDAGEPGGSGDAGEGGDGGGEGETRDSREAG